MTAEIAVLNRQAVALAADSAVTVESGISQKVFPSANKIFGLSNFHPVGIMIYQNAEFMSVPWETLIKLYRKHLGQTSFRQLSDYAKDLVEFLRTEPHITKQAFTTSYVRRVLEDVYSDIRNEVDFFVERRIEEKGSISESEVANIVTEVVDRRIASAQSEDRLSHLSADWENGFTKRHRKIIHSSKRIVFKDLPIRRPVSVKLTSLARLVFTRAIFGDDYSGVVIAGFGDDEIYPSVISMVVDGIIDGSVKYALDGPHSASRTNNAGIFPFAQQEMVVSFMEGVDPDYREITEDLLENILQNYPELIIDSVSSISASERTSLKNAFKKAAEKNFTELQKQLRMTRHIYWAGPVIQAVSMLQKGDLALMAETLVNLTAFKRKMSLNQETVSDPIDVAVISKGDGFVWIKQKHYFNLELNPHFRAKYYK